MVTQPAPALILFDIDGTLLRRAGPHHRQVLEDAIRNVTGRSATTDGIPVAGMLDRDILREMMLVSGLKTGAIQGAMPDIVARAQALYARRCPDLRTKVCPGARSFLARLARRKLPLGLVTGNLTRIGWTKMRRAGLEQHFRFGMFADNGSTRAELAKLAIDEARRRKWIAADALIALVGDHPNDIEAARANGIVSVAVGTGIVPWEELERRSPDFFVPNLNFLRMETLLRR